MLLCSEEKVISVLMHMQSSHLQENMITRGISVLPLRNIAASRANVLSTVSLTFTQKDILALSGDIKIMTGSFIPRMQCIFFLIVTVA